MIWELAGVLGVHPGPFSLRELFAMMTARRMHTWDWVTRICNRIRPEVPMTNPFRHTAPEVMPFNPVTWKAWMDALKPTTLPGVEPDANGR